MNLKEFIEQCSEEKDYHRVTMKRLYYDAFKSWIDDFDTDEPKEPRVIALKTLGLHSDDGFFIWSYTGSCSSWLNSDKRNCNGYDSECKQYFANGLTTALLKLPIYVGKVWRWEEADEKLKKFNWFKDHIGTTIKVPYFLSTSKDNITADPMLWDINTIEGGNAREITKISNAPCEQEILFLPDAKFLITGVEDDNRTVNLQELDPDTETQFDLCRVYYFEPEDIDPEMIAPGMFD